MDLLVRGCQSPIYLTLTCHFSETLTLSKYFFSGLRILYLSVLAMLESRNGRITCFWYFCLSHRLEQKNCRNENHREELNDSFRHCRSPFDQLMKNRVAERRSSMISTNLNAAFYAEMFRRALKYFSLVST